MQCPTCNVTLVMADRQGVEIDYCPQCRGVWLDRGELDKIIERTSQEPAPTAANRSREPQREPHREHYRDERSDRQYGQNRKKSLLKDFFDF